MEVRKRHNPESDLGPGYAHDLYEFEAGGVVLRARSYVHDASEAHFLGKTIDGELSFLSSADFDTELMQAALGHLRGDGKESITFLSEEAEGYAPVPNGPAAV